MPLTYASGGGEAGRIARKQRGRRRHPAPAPSGRAPMRIKLRASTCDPAHRVAPARVELHRHPSIGSDARQYAAMRVELRP